MDDKKSPLAQRPDYLVCTCMGVMYSEICEATDQGATSFEVLKELLMVGTGCTSCVAEIHEILAEKQAKKG